MNTTLLGDVYHWYQAIRKGILTLDFRTCIMKTQNKITKEVRHTFFELENYNEVTKNRLISLLRNLPKEEKIAKINELNFSDKSLNFLCEGIALETEDYEICAAVQEIKKQRALKKEG